MVGGSCPGYFYESTCYNRYECNTKQVCDTTCGFSCFQTCGRDCLRSVKECKDIIEEATCNSYKDCTWSSSLSSLLGRAEAGSHGTKAASTIIVLFFLTLGIVFLYRRHKTALVVVKVKAFLGQCFIKDHNDPNSNLDETVTDEEAMEANNGSIIQVEREGEMEDEQQQKDEMVEATKPMMTVAQSKSLGISSWNVLK